MLTLTWCDTQIFAGIKIALQNNTNIKSEIDLTNANNSPQQFMSIAIVPIETGMFWTLTYNALPATYYEWAGYHLIEQCIRMHYLL
jgi:hypothetical protein